MTYPRKQYCVGQDTSVLQCGRRTDKTVDVKPDLPCNVIVVHGVNDVGTSYGAVEEGLCAGLDARLYGVEPGQPGRFAPGTYRMPTAMDKERLEPDPDAVFFKRTAGKHTRSPVIPFYWGFAETSNRAKMKNGQHTDYFGNRLDKDLSKGGGPFGNATSTLPDMWNRGLYSPVDVGGDPVRPLLSAPGRMYMVLAARRLAALIAMIRDYDTNEAVTIVAHSQGCLVSLLAQAFLLDEGQRPADTLILTHPPYSLEEETTRFFHGAEMFKGGKDAAMDGQYGAIATRQNFDARLRTLVNIVHAVVSKKHTLPSLAALTDHGKYHGMVGARWRASADRDNRGKVYLYFCPEDMTVALDNIKGIGWQGVPDFATGTVFPKAEKGAKRSIWGDCAPQWTAERQERKPLSELGPGFFQRVFTSKPRFDLVKKTLGPVLVGQAPHDFALRTNDEDDHAHVADANRGHRASHGKATWPPVASRWDFLQTEAGKREGIRRINAEALAVPVAADLRGSGQIDPKDIPKDSAQAALPAKEQGPCEAVDPLDATTAVASDHGLKLRPEEVIDDPRPASNRIARSKGAVMRPDELAQIQTAIDAGKEPDDSCKIRWASFAQDGRIRIVRDETPNEARKRWQHEVSPKSFHGAIIGSAKNHRDVTAYDVAIGGGLASSDPHFYEYLCAVADWRLTKNDNSKRKGILRWKDFMEKFGAYTAVEPDWRMELIQGNADYYSSGKLPACVPALHKGMPSSVVCETVEGGRIAKPSDRESSPAANAGRRAV